MLVEQTQVTTLSGAQTLENILDIFNQGVDIQVQGKHKKNTLDDVANTRISTSHDFIYMQNSNGDSLIITPDHQVFDPVANEWTRACDISKTTHVLDSDNNTHVVVDCHKIKNPVATRVITLSLSKINGYYANNILVKSN